MGDLFSWLAELGSFFGGTGSFAAVLIALRQMSKKERRRAADQATKRLLEAAKDGKVTPEEAADLLQEHYGEGADE